MPYSLRCAEVPGLLARDLPTYEPQRLRDTEADTETLFFL